MVSPNGRPSEKSGRLAKSGGRSLAMISQSSYPPTKGGSPTKHRSLKKFLLLPCAAIAIMLIAASCGGSGAPTSFAQEDGGETVRQNFTEGCEVAVEDSQLAPNANAVCQCTYDKIVRDSATSDGITFEDFDEVDDDLREDINLLSRPNNDRVISKIREYMRNCITSNS